MTVSLNDVRQRLRQSADPERAKNLARYFKTGPGGYGEGDLFLGLRVPQVRKISKEFKRAPAEVVEGLLRGGYHEERLLALFLLRDRFARSGEDDEREKIFRFYLDNTRFVNNWDLVDASAPHIIGGYLEDKDRSLIFTMAASDDIWERRISIMSTFYFIRRGEFSPTLEISQLLLNDAEDLVHKAVGWMLREVGKRDKETLTGFLDEHYREMPRTMLRYSIEHFDARERLGYLKRR